MTPPRLVAATSIAVLLATTPAHSQVVAPVGAHDTSVGPGTGQVSPVSPTGGFAASVPLDLPSPRRELPVPLAIQYTGTAHPGVAGIGWDVPIWSVRKSSSTWHRKPAAASNQAGEDWVSERVILSMGGGAQLMVPGPESGLYLPFVSDEYMELREEGWGWQLSTAAGIDYKFTASTVDDHVWVLKTVVDRVGTDYVEIDYDGGRITRLRYGWGGLTGSQALYSIDLEYEQQAQPFGVHDNEYAIRSLDRVLKRVVVNARNNLVPFSQAHAIRSYELGYEPDADTGAPRLTTVHLRGEDGGTAQMPVARYAYGAATKPGQNEPIVELDGDHFIPVTQGALDAGFDALGGSDVSVSFPGIGGDEVRQEWTTTNYTIRDFTGDGVADLVYKVSGTWHLRRGVVTDAGFDLEDGVATTWTQPSEIHSERTLQYDDLSYLSNRRKLVTTETLKTFLDWNGDGRLDVIDSDTSNPRKWKVWLNLPAADGTPAWQQRELDVSDLYDHVRDQDLGWNLYWDSTFLPIERSRSWAKVEEHYCFEKLRNEDTGEEVPLLCDDPSYLQDGQVDTITEWTLTDSNGDGFPDFVANTVPARHCWESLDTNSIPDWADYPDWHNELVTSEYYDYINGHVWWYRYFFNHHEFIALGRACASEPDVEPVTNRPVVFLNRAGGLIDVIDRSYEPTQVGGTAPVSGWTTGETVNSPYDPDASSYDELADFGESWRAAGFADPNALGRTRLYGSENVLFERFDSDRYDVCRPGAPAGVTYTSKQIEGLVDLNGDAVPDRVYRLDGGGWRVRFATTAGYGEERTISVKGSIGFAISESQGTCNGDSTTVAGLVDVDGDGKPELLRRDQDKKLYAAYVTTSGGMDGDPHAAGRLTSISNEYGARTEIDYANNKTEVLTPHDVPAPEVVVAETRLVVDGVVAGPVTRYAYGTADMRHDPASGRRAFQGYRRMVTLVGLATGGLFGGVDGTATVVDRKPPASFLAPYEELVLGGRVERTTRLEGAFLSDPRPLLVSLPQAQIRAETAQSYGVVELETGPWPSGVLGALECMDLRADGNFSGNLDCHHAGIVHSSISMSWEGSETLALGDDNVATATQVLQVDEIGRPTQITDFGDTRSTADDRCTTIQYATPDGSSSPTTNAVAGVWVSDCGWTNPIIGIHGYLPGTPILIAGFRFLYDELSEGEVGRGRLTSRIVERYDTSDGDFLGEHVAETIAYHPAYGQISQLVSTRALGDAATRTTAFGWDPFGASVVELTESATDVLQPPFVRQTRSSTWPSVDHVVIGINGEQTTTERDGFGRPVAERVESSTVSHVTTEVVYVDDPGGRRIDTTTYPADETRPQRSHVHIDALGRPRFTQNELGADYGATVIEGLVEYDPFGRIFYEAAPFEWGSATFDPDVDLPATRGLWPYGVTTVFDSAGRVVKRVEARGQQPAANATSTGADIYVSTFAHVWKDGRAITRSKGASENESGSPSYGARSETLATALGWPAESVRYSSSGSRADLVQRGFDRFGQTTFVRRFGNASAMTGTVDWIRRYDSLGQVLSLEEPGTTPLSYFYDEWGEVLQTSRWEGQWQEITRQRYDGFGRPSSQEVLRRKLAFPPETTVESTELFHYDEHSGSTWQPPGVLRGRLSRIEAVGVGDTWFEYDELGRPRSETHVMAGHGEMMRTTREYLSGGTLAELRFDTPAGVDRIAYTLDSAARTREVAVVGGVTLLDIEAIDAKGRPLSARLGNQVLETYAYAPDGRQELLEWVAHTPGGPRRHEYQLRDAEGRLVLERYQPLSGMTVQVTHFYDVLDRLLRSRSIASNAQHIDEVFTYDSLGNFKTKRNLYATNQNRDYQYDTTDRDRLCRFDIPGQAVPGCQFFYDTAGNVVSDTSSGGRTFTYDSASRVTAITKGAWSASFLYGPAGSLTRTEVHNNGVLNRRIWRFGDLIEERRRPDGNTHIERRIPGPLGLVATLRTQGSTTETVYVHGDSRANRFFTTSTGAFAQQVRYRAFGGINNDTGLPQLMTYTDDLWNGGDDLRDLGVTVLGARIYDPTIGRFLQRDPVVHDGRSTRANPYSFAFDDPVNFADPSGRSACLGAEVVFCKYGWTGPGDVFYAPPPPSLALPEPPALAFSTHLGVGVTSLRASTGWSVLEGLGDVVSWVGDNTFNPVGDTIDYIDNAYVGFRDGGVWGGLRAMFWQPIEDELAAKAEALSNVLSSKCGVICMIKNVPQLVGPPGMRGKGGGGGRRGGGGRGRGNGGDGGGAPPPPPPGGAPPRGGGDAPSGGGDANPPRDRQPGDRMSEGASGEDAVDQLDGVEAAQRRARQQGAGDATIESTKKSQQNVDNRNRRIRNLEDALEEYGDDDADE